MERERGPPQMRLGNAAVAVLIPCLNEEATVSGVVADFRSAIPSAKVYVYDNGSTDDTAAAARAAGATVRTEPMRGKGNVVRRMFSDIEADVYVLVDGDGTYPAAEAPRMIAALTHNQLDMVGGARMPRGSDAYPRGHRSGNALITRVVGLIFGYRFEDVLTGYRVLSRRFVKSFPALSAGFEIETEIVVHTAQMRLPAAELLIAYGARPHGSASKLRTLRDGLAIARTIAVLAKEEKPLAFFSAVAALLSGLGLGLAWPFTEFVETGLASRLPTALLATGLGLLGGLCFAAGLVLDTVSRSRREAKRLRYLAFGPPPGPVPETEPVARDDPR